MNFRSTTMLFGLLLGMLWLFGLTVAHKKTAVDASYLLPTLQANPDVVIDSVTIERRVKGKEPEAFQFTKENDVWTLKVPNVQTSVKLDTFRVDQIVNQIKDARRSDEATVTTALATYDLTNPATVVTLRGQAKGKPRHEWKFNIGKESADQALMFVNTSDLPSKVYGVQKNNVDSVLFKDPNHLRSRRIFEFNDVAAQTVAIKAGSAELELKKGEDATWRFEKPALGLADYEGQPAPKDLPPGAKMPDAGGVKGLLNAIATMRVDSDEDFVPLSDTKLDTYGLAEGKESMLIQVGANKDRTDKKDVSRETLAIGSAIKDKNQVYARLVGDQGIFKLNSKLLEPIKAALQNPGALRSMDLVSLDAKKVDALVVEQKADKITLLHPEGKPWEVQAGPGKLQKANDAAVQAILEALQTKRPIVRFYDGDDYKKLDAEMKAPAVVLTVYLDGLDEGKKEGDKKEPAKDKKEAIPDATLRLKKDAKPAVTLRFGEADKENVNVERVMADGTTSRFKLPRTFLDKVVPGDLALAFLDPTLPAFTAGEIYELTIAREKDKLDIEKGWGDKSERWFFKESPGAQGKDPTDAANTAQLVKNLSALSAKKWLRCIDPKEDLDKFGLKKPALEVTLMVRKNQPQAMAILAGMLAAPSEWRGIQAGLTAIAMSVAGPVDKIVLKIGKDTEDDKDKPAVYALRSDKDFLFLLPADLVRTLREADLHDRSSVVLAQPLVGAALVALEIGEPLNLLLGASPLATNQVQSFDASKVKDIKVALRTHNELRTFAFERDPLNKKDWRDLSGLQEFNLDPAKINQLLSDLASLKAARWVTIAGGVKGDQKLTPKNATLRLALSLEDGKTVILTVGTLFEGLGYYAHTSELPDAVFMLAPAQIEPLLQGPAYFGKERLAAN